MYLLMFFGLVFQDVVNYLLLDVDIVDMCVLLSIVVVDLFIGYCIVLE